MANLGSKLTNFMKDPLKVTFNFFGENKNSAVIVAVTIAVFKGVFRPIYTLSDKKSDPQTKKYTAIREALTELIAIPVYVAIPALGKKLIVDKLYKTKTDIVKKAAETNIKFWGVLAATAIIPAVCNLVQPPIMNKLKQKQDAKNAVQPLNKPNRQSFSGNNPVRANAVYKNNTGMRVGS